jgi:hypothetical protein
MLLKGIESANIESRVAALEEKLAERARTGREEP